MLECFEHGDDLASTEITKLEMHAEYVVYLVKYSY